MNDIEDAVLQIAAKAAGTSPESIPPTATMRDVGISSLDAIEVLFQLEEKYDLLLSDQDVDLGTATVADLVKAVEDALARKQAPRQSMQVA